MKNTITINGYKVGIWAEQAKDGYFANWACECGETGGSNHLDKSKESCLAAAKFHANAHVTGKHSK